MAAVVVQSRAEVPAFNSMGRPSFSNGGLFVDEDASAGRGERGAVVIKRAMELCVGREGGVDARTTEEIETKQSVGNEAVPKVKRKIRVRTAQPGNKVILEGTDGAFGGVATVQMGWCQLEVDLVGRHKGL
jgi:RNase P/RNase MRP subunit p29